MCNSIIAIKQKYFFESAFQASEHTFVCKNSKCFARFPASNLPYVFQAHFFWFNVDTCQNRLAERAVAVKNKDVNLPNLITMARIPLIFVIGVLFYAPFVGAKTLAFILYVVTGVTDWLDGWVARKYHQISDFGKLMDALSDKIFVVSMFILLVGKGLVPNWGIFCILLIICREFFITGLRVMLAKNGTVMAAEKSGKVKTILQVVFTGAFFLIEMLRSDAAAWFPKDWLCILTNINNLLFVTATVLTIHSGCRYWRKYYRSLL